jgi:hypothetical protein
MCSFVEACEKVFIIQYLLLLGGRRARVLAQDDLNEASILLPDWKQKLQYKLLEVVPTSNSIMCLFNSMLRNRKKKYKIQSHITYRTTARYVIRLRHKLSEESLVCSSENVLRFP